MIQARGRDGTGTKRENIIHDREIVDGKIPEHIDVVLKKTEIYPNGVVVINFAQTSTVNEFADLADRAGIHEGVIDHEHQISLLRHIHEVLYLAGVGRERFLDEHVLAFLQGAQSEVVVGGDWCGNGYRVDRGIFDQFTKIARGPDGRITVVEQSEAVFAEIADTGDLRFFGFKKIADQVRSPVAVSDHADSNQRFPLSPRAVQKSVRA